MGAMKRGWVLVSVLLALLGGCAECAVAQAPLALTTVQDTVYTASGAPASGTVVLTWPGFTTASGTVVPAGTMSATIGTSGLLSVTLAPNAGATPIGSYYTATFHLSDGSTSREYWVVPVTVAGAPPVKLAAIQNNVLPTSVAMQTVSKTYVDMAIAAAVTGHPADSSTPYVMKVGDTMTGPLVLAADPVSANQAANKNYVDASVNAARVPVFGASGSAHATGVVPDPGATAGVTRYLREDSTWDVPAGGGSGTMASQNASAVAITGGSIDGTAIGASTPANGQFATLFVANNFGGSGYRLQLAGQADLNHYIYSTGSTGNTMVFGEYSGDFHFYAVNAGIDAGHLTPAGFAVASVQPKVYAVSALPSASTLGNGAVVVVSDSAGAGTCAGGGAHQALAVSNGSGWTCMY